MLRRNGLLALALFLGSCLPSMAQPIGTIYRRVNASVVVIKVKQKQLSRTDGRLVSVGGLGSGVIISDDGKVLTAAHVVQVADEIEVEVLGGETVTARVIGSLPQMDIALLQLDSVPKAADVAPVGDSDEVQVGDRVFVVGAPFGIDHTLTVGYVSARRAPTENESGIWGAEFFQTDAAVNPGNSGGPMFSMAGEVVGIVSHIISLSGGSEGLGFAVTTNTVRQMLLNRKPFWSGIESFYVAGDMAGALNLPVRGLLVQRIAKDSPAEKIGLRPGVIPATIGEQPLLLGGDFILGGLGIKLTEENAYERIMDKMAKLKQGDAITVSILRAGVEEELSMPFPGH
jgi:S1-C subfamily serine protease